MSFGRNPYPAKAELAELKATEARDDDTRRRCLLDAARQWDRAAEREKPGKFRTKYEENARRNREEAEGPAPTDDAAEAAPEAEADAAPVAAPEAADPDDGAALTPSVRRRL